MSNETFYYLKEFLDSNRKTTRIPFFVSKSTFANYLVKFNKKHGCNLKKRGSLIVKNEFTPSGQADKIAMNYKYGMVKCDLPDYYWESFRVYLSKYYKGFKTRVIETSLYVYKPGMVDNDHLHLRLEKERLIKKKKEYQKMIIDLDQEIEDIEENLVPRYSFD
jgi:hypothetical protein